MNIGLQITGNPEKYQSLLADLHTVFPEDPKVKFHHIPDSTELNRMMPNLDVLVCYKLTPASFEKRTDKLRWIHFGAAGIEHSLFHDLLRSRVTITNARGIHAGPVSEYVLGAMLYFTKRFADCQSFQVSREWTQWTIARQMTQLAGKTVGVVGYGAIGKAVLNRCQAFGMRTMAIRRTQRFPSKNRLAAQLLPVDHLPQLLQSSDFIVLALPLTPFTRHLLDESMLAMVKSTAILVNISRGAIVDEIALVSALGNHRLTGAALDVFWEEPLPPDHPLFDMDNVLLSPHISGNFPEYQRDTVLQFGVNLRRFCTGKSLLNRVGKRRLY